MKLLQEKLCYIDFEYNQTEEEKVNPLCVAWQKVVRGVPQPVEAFWIEGDDEGEASASFGMEDMQREGFVFVSYSWEAESRALLALGLNPLTMTETSTPPNTRTKSVRAVDLYLEYRQLLNHNHDLEYGKQLINGKVLNTTPPPRWQEERDEDASYNKAEYNLGAAVFKMLGEIIDTKEKKEVRSRIIQGGKFSSEEKKRIVEYCKSDIVYLHRLHEAMWSYLVDYLRDKEEDFSAHKLLEQQYKRAEYAARTAKMVSIGYPVNMPSLRALSSNIPHFTLDLQRDINKRVEKQLGFKMFTWNPKLRVFTRNVALLSEWVTMNYGKKWPKKTPTGAPCLDEETLSKVSSARHDFSDHPVDQMLRWARFNQAINGFKPMREATKKTIYDYMGSDDRARPYMGIYGSQSSRSQPSATGYIFLKSAMFRGLVHPKPWRMIIGSDYGSQEFYIAALLSGDEKMRKAYESGDVYLGFAIDAKLAPKDATRATHDAVRERCKAFTLGISYDMTAPGLANKITNDTKVPCSLQEAERLVELFETTYSTYHEWKTEYKQNYFRTGVASLKDGWRMLGDNQNFRSVGNFPMQGMGAVIMRLAVAKAQDAGLDVIMTLHDAIYVEADLNDWSAAQKLKYAMGDAFRELMGDDTKVRQDFKAWGEGLSNGTVHVKYVGDIETQSTFIDKRAKKEYEQWKRYMEPDEFIV